MSKDRYFIIDYDLVIAENLTDEDLISYAYEKWDEDYEIKKSFEEPEDIDSAIEYLEHYYRIIEGEYIA
jgi:hypothetical protein